MTVTRDHLMDRRARQCYRRPWCLLPRFLTRRGPAAGPPPGPARRGPQNLTGSDSESLARASWARFLIYQSDYRRVSYLYDLCIVKFDVMVESQAIMVILKQKKAEFRCSFITTTVRKPSNVPGHTTRAPPVGFELAYYRDDVMPLGYHYHSKGGGLPQL